MKIEKSLRRTVCGLAIAALILLAAGCPTPAGAGSNSGDGSNYTVTFNSAGATTAAIPATMTVISPATKVASLPTEPEISGNLFLSWWTGENGSGTQFTADTPVTADITVYAKWTSGYTITFYPNTGVGSVTTQVIYPGVTAPLSANTFTKADYNFAGWATTSTGSVQYVAGASYAMGAANADLYALWSAGNLADITSGGKIATVDMGTAGNTVTYTQSTSTTAGFSHTLSAFSIGKYEVTYELWYAVRQWALANGYLFQNAGQEGYGTIGAAPTAANKLKPVTSVNWRDCIVWCNAYSQMTGLTPVYYTDALFTTPLKDSSNGVYATSINATLGGFDQPYVRDNATGYRLPTEGEWQYAASDAGATPFDWASGAATYFNDVQDLNTNGIPDGKEANDAVAVYSAYWDGSAYTSTGVTVIATVGTKAANAMGLHDMSGNANEFCFDGYATLPTSDKINYRNNTSYLSAGYFMRIIRGGDYYQRALLLPIGYRLSSFPYTVLYTYGFRIARSL